MWYKLNESIGIILLIVVVGGVTIYGAIKLFIGPPLLRQNSQSDASYDSQYARAAKKDLDRRLHEIQQRQSQVLQNSIDVGRRATSGS